MYAEKKLTVISEQYQSYAHEAVPPIRSGTPSPTFGTPVD
jgi:hypothetical protein